MEDLAMSDEADMDKMNGLQFGLRELIDITQGIMTNVDIVDNKAMSIIYECWAKVYASTNDWNNSYRYFQEAFLLYQQIAHENTAKCLKSLLIAYMILSSLPSDENGSNEIPNPFAMDEIKVYQYHEEIVVMNNIVDAFENDNIAQFNKLLKQQYDTDPFIMRYLHFVQLRYCLVYLFCVNILFIECIFRLQGKALCNLVQSYDRVKLKWLCTKLGLNMEGMERLIVQLIINGELNARLDQVNMILILREKDNQTNAYSIHYRHG